MSSVAATPRFGETTPTARVDQQAARGALWTIILSVANKVVALGSQIALAWFLLPEDMGVVALALSVTGIVVMFSGGNLKNILIQRSQDFEETAGQVFWLSLAMNFLCAGCLAVVSPLAGKLYGEPGVSRVIYIACLALPLMALPTIYAARLSRELRFDTIARIQFGEGLIRSGLAVPLAAAGWGAYSLVAPMLVSTLFAFACVRRSAGKVALSRPDLRTWPSLLRPGAWLMVITLVTALHSNGVSLVIGLLHEPLTAGLFFWGFSLSSQAVFLLATNLQGVFFPVLTKFNGDLKTQKEAFERLCRLLLLAVTPVCILQWFLAEPFIRLVFHEKWLPAVPVVQWLSFGMLTQPLGILANSLLLAQSKNRKLALLTTVQALVTISAGAVGGCIGNQVEISACVGLAMLVSNVYAGWIGYRQFCTAGDSKFGKIFLPVLFLPPLGLVGWLVGKYFPYGGHLGTIILTTLTVVSFFIGLVSICFPSLIRGSLQKLSLVKS